MRPPARRNQPARHQTAPPPPTSYRPAPPTSQTHAPTTPPPPAPARRSPATEPTAQDWRQPTASPPIQIERHRAATPQASSRRKAPPKRTGRNQPVRRRRKADHEGCDPTPGRPPVNPAANSLQGTAPEPVRRTGTLPPARARVRWAARERETIRESPLGSRRHVVGFLGGRTRSALAHEQGATSTTGYGRDACRCSAGCSSDAGCDRVRGRVAGVCEAG